MRNRVIRWGLRMLFAAFAAFLIVRMTAWPTASLSPTLYEARTAVLMRAATADVPTLDAAEPDAADAPVPEPDDPWPIEEEREPGDIFALMYHALTEEESETSDWCTTPDKLREDLTTLMELGYRPLSIEDYASGEYEIGPDYFIVTFDDGYASNAALAEPVLVELGVPAAMFVITGSTELSNHLSWDELAAMQSRGVISVYTHTHSHADGLSMSTASFLADVTLSWDEIVEHLEEPVYKILSYPNGSHTRETMRALAKDGFSLFVIQSTPWWFEPEEGSDADADGIRVLVRMNVSYDADIHALLALNRERMHLETIEEKLEALRLAAEEALAAERAERSAWLRKWGETRTIG